MPVSVGIDLGTTFSAVAMIDPKTGLPKIIPNGEGGNITPSIIQFINGEPIFGSEAASAFAAGEPDCVATFKRNMGKDEAYCVIEGKAYTSLDLSALLLGHLKREAEATIGTPIEEAVITVPAYFRSPEREATIDAAKKAGLIVKKLIDEPNAASLTYGLKAWRENANILVYDLGGGTFDVTLVRMEKEGELNTIATQGDHYLGGKDWDNRIEDLLFKKFIDESGIDEESHDVRMIARGLSEEIKIRLSGMPVTTVKTSLPGYGRVEVTISRDEFESNMSDLLDRTGSLCKAVLSEVGITANDITDIVLVGGSTRMPQVSNYLEKTFGKKPLKNQVHPDEAVALGAAIQSAKANEGYVELSTQIAGGKKVVNRSGVNLVIKSSSGQPKKLSGISVLTLRETTAHAMGMIAISEEGSRYINDVIIPANHARPTRAAKGFIFHTSAKENREMDIYLLQGDKENPTDNLITGRYVISGIRHIKEQRGKTTIRVQYSYDVNGIIQVSARQENDSSNLNIRKDSVPDDMNKYGLPIDPSEFKPETLSVVLAVDVSGSMKGSPLDDAKQAMCSFVRDMDFSYTQVGIIAVSDASEIVCNLTSNENQCIQAINSITCGQTGGGNSAHPFITMSKMLENEEGRRYAITLADGMWFCNDDPVIASKRCNDLGIETAAIGFGTVDQNFLRSISSSDANAMLVSQSELTQAFGSIAQSLGGSEADSGAGNSGLDIETWDDWND